VKRAIDQIDHSEEAEAEEEAEVSEVEEAEASEEAEETVKKVVLKKVVMRILNNKDKTLVPLKEISSDPDEKLNVCFAC